MRKHLIVAASLIAVALVGPATAGAERGSLDGARAATAKYHRLQTAIGDGYGRLVDAQGIACIDNPGVGGMGIHYVSDALVGDAAVNATTPEALVYEPRKNGRLRLVALEYVVFQSAWDKAHKRPPKLFGRRFELIPAGNRYGLPPFYELHAWAWKHNPRGMFDDLDPRVPQLCRGRGAHIEVEGTRRAKDTQVQVDHLVGDPVDGERISGPRRHRRHGRCDAANGLRRGRVGR